MIKLSVLWWIPAHGAWEHGWRDYEFPGKREAYLFCREKLSSIECAELGHEGAVVVSDGKLICQDCGDQLGPEDQGVYPVCAACDVWEDCNDEEG